MSAMLYEHEDGRYAVAESAELAIFAADDPKWHRVGPVEIVKPASRIDYATIPPRVREALDQHAQEHRPTGDFTTAVLENNLMEAVGRADNNSLAALPSIVAYVYNELPGGCHGSPAKVKAWRERRES